MDIANEDNNSTDDDYVPNEDEADESETDRPKKSKVTALSQNLNEHDDGQTDCSKGDKDADSDDDDECAGGRFTSINEEEKWKRSEVWNYFVDVNKDKKTATCRMCFNEYSFFTRVGNLSSHLKTKHKIHLTLGKHWTENLDVADSQNGLHRRSEIWNHFEDLDSKKKTARCHICDRTLSYLTTTGNLNTHLRNKHGIVLIKKPNAESENDAPNVDDKKSAEQKIVKRSEFWEKFTVTDESKKLATCNICGQELYFGFTSNLKQHLFRMHGDGEYIKDWNNGKATEMLRGDRVPRYLRPSRRYSTVWNVFDVKNEREKTATCRVCKKDLSFKTTIGNLKHHLKSMHSWVTLDQPYEEDEDGEEEIAEEQTSPVWAYFKCLSKELKLASCLICKKRLDYDDERDLNCHLGRKHPRVLNDLETNTKPKKLMITNDGDIYEIDDDVAKQEPETEIEQDTGSEGWQHNNDETDALENLEYLDESIFNEPSPEKKIRFTPDRRPSRTQTVTTSRAIQPVRKKILIGKRKSTQEDEDCSIELFSKYMTSLLKKLPKHKSDKLQADFIRQIMDAQINECQNTSTVHNSYRNTRSPSSLINIRSPKSIDDAITSNSDVQRVITSDGKIRQLVVGNEVIVSSAGN